MQIENNEANDEIRVDLSDKARNEKFNEMIRRIKIDKGGGKGGGKGMSKDGDKGGSKGGNGGHYIISYGGVEEVSGSMHMIVFNEGGEKEIRILLDAGGFQGGGLGGSAAIEKNRYLSDSIDVSKIDYIILTHAHYDHIGRLPILYQRGFRGQIICTRVTRILSFIVLNDSLNIIMDDEDQDMLFEKEDLDGVKKLFVVDIGTGPTRTNGFSGDVEFPEWKYTDDKGNVRLKLRFIPGEHIIGSASILIEYPVRLLYTGDLGGGWVPLHGTPKPIVDSVDYLLIESTYGDRIMEKKDLAGQLYEKIDKVMKRKGRLLIPCMAIDRIDEILYLLREMGIKDNIYLDTPMGSDVLDIYNTNKFVLGKIREMGMGDKDASATFLNDMTKLFRPDNLKRVGSRNMSIELNMSNESCIILAASGMLTGGRVMVHLGKVLSDEKNMLLFTCYQVSGTLGRYIADGNKEIIIEKKIRTGGEGINNEMVRVGTITGEERVVVKCDVDKIDGLSGHADKEGLLKYIDGFRILPKKIFVVHGEMNASDNLKMEIEKRYKVETNVIRYNTRYDLDEGRWTETIVNKDISGIDKFVKSGELVFKKISGIKVGSFLGYIVDNGEKYLLVGEDEVRGILDGVIEEKVRESKGLLEEKMDIVSGRLIDDIGISGMNIINDINDINSINNINGINDTDDIVTDNIEIVDTERGFDTENIDNFVYTEETENADDINPNEFATILLTYFNGGLISKGLAKSLRNATNSGMTNYIELINKKIQNGVILLDKKDLESNGLFLTDEQKARYSNQLARILRSSGKMNLQALQTCLDNVIDKIKDVR